jgi:hypothetical protein
MSAILFGVPGKLKTLLARIPTNNTTIMGRINDTISSRAPANTAVSNAVLTPARSALLDNLDAAITSLTSATTDTNRDNAIQVDLASLATGQGVLAAAAVVGTIKTLYTVTLSKTGGGTVFSSYFNGSAAATPQVNAAKTIIHPLSMSGGGGSGAGSLPIAPYLFKLQADRKRLTWLVKTNYVTGTYEAVVLVVEYN